MANIVLPDGDGDERTRMWSLMPDVAAAVNQLNEVQLEHTRLSVREAEAVRARIAHLNRCEICTQSRSPRAVEYGMDEAFYDGVDDPDARDDYSPREGLAIEFGERFAAGSDAFDADFWSKLNSEYTPEEVVDLAVYVAKALAFGRLNAVMDLAVACEVRTVGEAPGLSRGRLRKADLYGLEKLQE